MVLIEWFDRFLGTVAAPDAKYEPPVNDGSLFWDTVAPDPNFTASSEEFLTTELVDEHIQCTFCGNMTPISESRCRGTTTSTPASTTTSTTLTTPTTSATARAASMTSSTPLLDSKLRDSAHATLLLSSPGYQNKRTKSEKFMKLFMGPYSDLKHDKVAKMLVDDPNLLLYGRVQQSFSNKDDLREGYSPLHVVSTQGNIRAIQLILSTIPISIATEAVQLVTTQGRTALHLAASKGHNDVVHMLQEFCLAHNLDWQTEDLLGQTPLGLGLTSPDGKRVARSLMKTLLNASDTSVYGRFTAPDDRSYYLHSQQIVVGVSEMPGERAAMEDTTLLAFPSDHFTILGVLDGHDDGRQCSSTAAAHLQRLITCNYDTARAEELELSNVFQSVDDLLRTQQVEAPGGTTACLALITDQLLQVANVGDSRCLLIQQIPPSSLLAEDEHLETRLRQIGLSECDTVTFKVGDSTMALLTLTRDHKPNLPTERTRIEAAGLTVEEIQYSEQGEMKSLHKILLKNDLKTIDLGMSRSLGDFDFKSNKALPADQQAVIALPEIVTRDRSPYDSILILACDGVYDVMSNEQVAQYVISALHSFPSDSEHVMAKVADQLCRKCFDLGSQDNMSVILVALGETATRYTVTANSGATTSPALDVDDGLATARKLKYDSPEAT